MHRFRPRISWSPLSLGLLYLAQSQSAWAIPDHQSYDFALGQPNRGMRRPNYADDRSYNRPADVAVDKVHTPNHVYVADSANARVLGWKDITTFRAGAAPDLILGQSDKISVDRFRKDAKSISAPTGLAVDKDGTLYVSDESNGRVLGFRWPFDPGKSQEDNLTADVVIGQPDFVTGYIANGCNGGYLYSGPAGTANDGNLCRPAGLAVDPDGNLYVADFNNSRILAYKAPIPIAGAKAQAVFGQTTPQSAAGTQKCNQNLGKADANTLCRPTGVFAHQDGGTLRLYIADTQNHRVLVYDDPWKDQIADRVFGQPNMTTNVDTKLGGPTGLNSPQAVVVDSKGLVWIADTGAHRVLGFAGPFAGTSGFGAQYVFGQPDTAGNLPNHTPQGRLLQRPNAASLYSPRGFAFDGDGRLLLADQSNHRVLVVPNPTQPNPTAQVVHGQPSFTHGMETQTKATGLAFPVGVAVDRPDSSRPGEPSHVYVADSGNNRVLGWWDMGSFVDGKPFDLLIGQKAPIDYECNMGGGVSARTVCAPRGLFVDAKGDLWVADTFNHRVLRFPRPFAGPRLPVADLVLGQASFLASKQNRDGGKIPGAGTLWHPSSVVIEEGGVVWVADRDNDRVLGYAPPYNNGMDASRLLLGNMGGTFTTLGCPTRPSGSAVCGPGGLALDDQNRLWVAERDNHRVALYNTNPPPMSPLLSGSALAILGQSSQANVTANAGGAVAANTLGLPEGVSVEFTVSMGKKTAVAIYVADSGNNRILSYAPIASGFMPNATTVYGQPALNRNTQNLDRFFNETPANVQQGLWYPGAVFAIPEVLLIADTGPTSAFSTRAGHLQPGSLDSGNNRVLVIKGPTFPAPSGTPWTPPDGGMEEQVPDMMPEPEESADMRMPEGPDLAMPPAPADLRPTTPPPGQSGCSVGTAQTSNRGALWLVALSALALVVRRRRRN